MHPNMERRTSETTNRKPDAQTFGHRFSKPSFPPFPCLSGTIAQVALSIYLPILIGQVIDQVLVTGSSPVFFGRFSSDDLGDHRKYTGTMGQSSSL